MAPACLETQGRLGARLVGEKSRLAQVFARRHSPNTRFAEPTLLAAVLGRRRRRLSISLRRGNARLRARLALPRTTDISTLTAAVAARSGRAQPDVLHLLSPGRVPPDDLGLTRLADMLDQLENEVRLS